MASNTVIPPNVSGSDFSFNDAPGGDMNFDDLFPSTEGNVLPPTTAEPGTTSKPAPAPQEPVAPTPPLTPEDFYLKAGETVYKSKEDAERGIQFKDSVIEQLRQRYIFEHGVDPLTNRPVDIPGTYGARPQEGQPQVPANYLQNAQAYFDDLVNAVQQQDHNAYLQAQAKLVFDILEPLAPVISEITKERAVQNVGKEIKDFGDFVGSESYNSVLQEQPALKEAIQLAESNYQMFSQLPGLYKLAYWASQGRRLPELLKAAQQPPATPPPPARPLTRPATAAPPVPTAAPDIRTPEGRKALIAQLEASGVATQKW